jgi:hypothetical protein
MGGAAESSWDPCPIASRNRSKPTGVCRSEIIGRKVVTRISLRAFGHRAEVVPRFGVAGGARRHEGRFIAGRRRHGRNDLADFVYWQAIDFRLCCCKVRFGERIDKQRGRISHSILLNRTGNRTAGVSNGSRYWVSEGLDALITAPPAKLSSATSHTPSRWRPPSAWPDRSRSSDQFSGKAQLLARS